MKKTLSLILALLMSVSCASYIFADDAEVTAISEDAAVEEAVEEVETPAEEATPYDRAIRFLTTYNVMHGYEDGLLHAEKDVERYQMALFIGRITTGWVEDDSWEDFDANDSGFSDLKGTAAENVYGAMSYVSQKGIIEGYPDGTFKPEQVVTYREALTMAVRALGYQGLEYPWGYIEKAVSLGLTDGITGVAYTDVINRGVAAQIIYNAMFADGSKLAAKNFDGALGWANIIVTSSVITDDVKAEYTTAEYKTPVDYVSFQVIEKDGTLGKDVYYVKASELALDEGHADELAIGTPYAALFKIDDNDNYVELIDYEAYAPTTVKNEGRTDNEGAPIEVVDKIGAFLKDYTLVDKYSAKILANAGKLANELIVATVSDVKVLTGVDYNKSPYAFDWATGNILKGTKYDETKKEYTEYVTAWHYDATHNYYFEIITKDVKVDGEVVKEYVGINILDEKEIVEIQKAVAEAIKVYSNESAYTFTTSIGSAIYATLNAYNVDDDAVADYATYESYTYGKISQDKKSVDNCGDKPAVAVNGGVIDVLDSAACDHYDGIWWQDEYAPVLDADGKIVPAYVIYGYNPVTKELKVIKTIEKYSDDLVDADTYYATGILRGYSISKGYVVIGEQKFEFNKDFGDFALDFSKKTEEVSVNKLAISNYFDGLFNQFVKYYLLDGKVVKIEAEGAISDNYIVVESFAGISSDGYIVVNGYSTADLKLTRFRIASYDQWNEGHYYWYGTKADAEKAFTKGQVYQVTSYDPDEDLYFVNIIGKVVVKTEDQYGNPIKGIEVSSDKKFDTITISQGYRLYNGNNPKKVSSSDKYIIIGAANEAGYMPIAAFEGKANDGWTVTGQVLVGDKDANRFIIVNAKRDIIGFNADAWSNAGLVMVLNKTVLDKFFDGADVDEDEWYLQGATEVNNILVFNFLNGTFEYVTAATNVNVAKGEVYKTIDGVLSTPIINNWDNVWSTMKNTYADSNKTTTADYIFDEKVTVDKNFFADGNKDYVSANEVAEQFNLTLSGVKGLVNSLKIVKVEKTPFDEETAKGNVVTNISLYEKADFEKDTKNNGIESFVAKGVYKINENGTVDAVIYVTDVVAAGETVDKGETAKTSNVIGITADAGILGSVTFDKKVTTEYDADLKKAVDTTLYTIKGIGFELTGSAALRNNHSDVVNDGLYFDVLPRCTEADDWDVTFTATMDRTGIIGFPAAEKVYGEEITYTTFDNHDVEENPDCDLIKGFSFGIDEITLAEGQVAYLKANFNVQGTYNRTCDIFVQNDAGKLVVKFYDGLEPAYQCTEGTPATPVELVPSVK